LKGLVFKTRCPLGFFLTLALLVAVAPARAGILEDVQGLSLGFGGYTLGRVLTVQEKEIARKHPVAGAYTGTYKFADKDLVVVADSKSDRILALYREIPDGDRSTLKNMVVLLMDRFGEPTTMAHEKILYWAFTRNGLLDEEAFNLAKKEGRTDRLGIIATVKLNSEMEISPDPVSKEGAETSTPAESGRGKVYFLITSEPLLRRFIDQGDHGLGS